MSRLPRLIEKNFRDNDSPLQRDHPTNGSGSQNDEKVGVGVGRGIDEAHFKSVVAKSNPGLPYRRLRLHEGGALVVWPEMLFANSRGSVMLTKSLCQRAGSLAVISLS